MAIIVKTFKHTGLHWSVADESVTGTTFAVRVT